MKKKIKIIKEEQGITLVALVVTIVILLILAGVAINMALGDNGLFKRSKEAVNTWKSAEENETGALDYLDREWDNLINGGNTGNAPTEPEPPEEPDLTIGDTVDDIVLPTDTEEPTTVTIGGEEIVIPPKFTIAEDSGKIVPEGIVVVDPQENEWVWIPCYVEEGKGSNITGRVEYTRTAFKGENITTAYKESLLTTSEEYLSIKQYGGYYIGRYEAGDKESTEAGIMRGTTGSTIGTSINGDSSHTVSIKKNQIPYNWVTQEQCKTLSEGMTSIDGTNTNKLNGAKVFTKLCSSYSWDTALNFIQKTHSTYGSTSKINDEVVAGNYSDHLYSESQGLLNTGKTLAVCNIYDMGGNVWEYTTERYINGYDPYAVRGGHFGYNDSYTPAGSRSISGSYAIDGAGPADGSYGFRPILFVRGNSAH